jgi:hypothetical protein
MITQQIDEFASRVVSGVGDRLEAITYYPHPFTNGGLIIVPKDSVEFLPDLISEVYQLNPPPIMMYFLRKSELFQLSTVGVFGWTIPLEEKPHLAFWLKNRGRVLYGRDIRKDIQLPQDTSSFLEIHVQRIKHCIRNWVLEQLARKNFKGVVTEMERQVRYLMATALLASRGEWEFSAEVIPDVFDRAFDNSLANGVWRELLALTRRSGEQSDADEARQYAYEAVWLFEQFLLQSGGLDHASHN